MRAVKILGCIAAISVVGCQDKTEDKTSEPVKPQAVAVSTGQIAKIINASGKVKPEMTVQVGSEISGKLLSVNVDFNSPVKKGDILAVIDPDNFENKVSQNEAQVENAEASIKVSEASLRKSEVNLEQAKKSYNRRVELYAENAISQAQLEETEKVMRVAEADIDLAQARLDVSRSSLKQFQANLRTAKVDLARTVIRSPIDGVILERMVDAGQTVAASLSAPELFKIVNDLSKLKVDAAIVESDVSGLDKGDPVSFSVDAYPAQRFRGQVEQLRLQSESNNNIVTYTAVVSADNPQGLLLPGMTANLQITTDSKNGILRIPAAAERFRPTPSQIKEWQAEIKESGTTDIAPKARERLADIGVSTSEIDRIMTRMERDTESVRKDIDDPTKNWFRNPNLKKLSAMKAAIIKDSLSTTDFQKYQQIIQSQSQIRDVEVWLLDGDKIRKINVSLGLSDGSFVEVISGLSEDDQVVTGFSGSEPKGPPGKRRG
jgi:HlyD family secretion protein